MLPCPGLVRMMICTIEKRKEEHKNTKPNLIMNTYETLIKKLTNLTNKGLWAECIATIDEIQELRRQEVAMEDELDAQCEAELAS